MGVRFVAVSLWVGGGWGLRGRMDREEVTMFCLSITNYPTPPLLHTHHHPISLPPPSRFQSPPKSAVFNRLATTKARVLDAT